MSSSVEVKVIVIFQNYTETEPFNVLVSKQYKLEDFKDIIIQKNQIQYPKWKPPYIDLLLLQKQWGEANYEMLPVNDKNIFFPAISHGFEYIYYASIFNFRELKIKFEKALFEVNAEISIGSKNIQTEINVETTVKDLINQIKSSYDSIDNKYLQLFRQKFTGIDRMHANHKISHYYRRYFLVTDQITTYMQTNSTDHPLRIKGEWLDSNLKENEYIYRIYYDTGYRILLYGYIRETTEIQFYNRIPRDIIESINLFFFDNEIYSINYNCIGNCILNKKIPIIECKAKVSKLLRNLDVIMPPDLMRFRKLTVDTKRMGAAYFDSLNLFNNEKKSERKKDFIEIVAQRITKREYFTEASRLINIGRFTSRPEKVPIIGIFREVCLVEYNKMKLKEFLQMITEQVYETIETIKLDKIKICAPKPYMIKKKQYESFHFVAYSQWQMDNYFVKENLAISNGHYVLYNLEK